MSLRRVEAALQQMDRGTIDSELFLEVASYFGELVRRNLGGEWGIDETAQMPVVRIADGQVEYPLLRSIKFLEDGDLLSDWFDFLSRGGERLLT